MIASCSKRRDAEGKRISEIAAGRGVDPVDAALELLVAEGGKGSMILFQLDERDLGARSCIEAVMIGSDGSALAPGGTAGGKPHPRSYGTFPRVLGEYAREQRVLSLAQAVHKMTALPARRLGLKDRGVIAVGKRADLVVFDARRVGDRATYQEPHQYPSGIEHVLVNGTFVIKDGEHTGSLPGRAPHTGMKSGQASRELLAPISAAPSVAEGLREALRRLVAVTGSTAGVVALQPQ